MARIDKLNVSGMSIEDIRQLNTRTLTDRALKQALNRLVSAANKRLRRLYNDPYGRYSPAVMFQTDVNGNLKPFTAKGKNTRDEIKAEFDRVRNFLDPSKTSHTLSGWKKIVKRMQGKGVNYEDLKSGAFWGLFRYFAKTWVPASFSSDELIVLISSAVDHGLYDASGVENFLKWAYENKEGLQNGETEQGNYFGDFKSEFNQYDV